MGNNLILGKGRISVQQILKTFFRRFVKYRIILSKKPVHKPVAIMDANSFWRVQQETFCTAKFLYWLCKLNFCSKSVFLGNPCSNVFNFPAKKLRKNTVPQNTHAPDFFSFFNKEIIFMAPQNTYAPSFFFLLRCLNVVSFQWLFIYLSVQ